MLTNLAAYVIIIKLFCAGVAQLVEQLICNQQVGGSNPSTSSKQPCLETKYSGVYPSGQRGQTVNLLSMTSVVRIHPLPPKQKTDLMVGFLFWSDQCDEMRTTDGGPS